MRENLIKEADRLFSIVIRKRDADEYGMVKCANCLDRLHWTIMTCGHFVKRRNLTTRWCLENAAPQCYHCNINDFSLATFIDRKFGKETSNRMMKLGTKTVKLSLQDLKNIINNLKKQL